MTDRIRRTLTKKPAKLLFFSFLLSLVFAPYLSVHVQAEPNPVNLVLDGGVTTPWTITNIKPGDNGTSSVILRNAGTSDGIVSIWISNLVNLNVTAPDSKYAGSTANLSDYLFLKTSCPNLETNLSLPCKLSAFPHEVSASRYARINPLKAGQTANLTWTWELPTDTGNEVQGKGASFDINYMLVEIPQPAASGGGGGAGGPARGGPGITATSTSIPPPTLSVNMLGNTLKVETDASGALLQPLQLTDSTNNFIFKIERGGRITSDDGTPISRIEMTKTEEQVIVPSDSLRLSPVYKITGYIGDTALPIIRFEPSSTLTILYDTKNLPENSFPPYIANYTDWGSWIKLDRPIGSVLELGKAEAVIYHASMYAVLAEVAPPAQPLPAEFVFGNLRISPKRVQQDKPVSITITVENKGELKGNYELYLTIDGVVQAVQEVALDGLSTKTISFTVSNLAAGTHRIKVAGLTGDFQVLEASATSPVKLGMGWGFIDLVVAVIIGGLLIAVYLLIRKSQRLQQNGVNLANVIKILRGKGKE